MKQLCLVCAVAVAAAAGCASDDPSVVGDWRVTENALVGDTFVVGPERLGFRDDGIFLFDDAEAGRYEVEGDRMELVYTAPEPDVGGELGFVVTADRLLLEAHFPEGEVDGAVGTWVGDLVMRDGNRVQRTIDLAVGGNMMVIENGVSTSGTWQEDGESLRLSFSTYDELWFRLDELGIGNMMLERME